MAPPKFRLTSSSTAELREGGGGMSLFGVPFFLAGVYVALAAIGLAQIEPAPTQGWERPVFALVSLVFLGAGGVTLFRRRWVTLDIASGSWVRIVDCWFPCGASAGD